LITMSSGSVSTLTSTTMVRPSSGNISNRFVVPRRCGGRCTARGGCRSRARHRLAVRSHRSQKRSRISGFSNLP
jgi:hypothetical protein